MDDHKKFRLEAAGTGGVEAEFGSMPLSRARCAHSSRSIVHNAQAVGILSAPCSPSLSTFPPASQDTPSVLVWGFSSTRRRAGLRESISSHQTRPKKPPSLELSLKPDTEALSTRCGHSSKRHMSLTPVYRISWRRSPVVTITRILDRGMK